MYDCYIQVAHSSIFLWSVFSVVDQFHSGKLIYICITYLMYMLVTISLVAEAFSYESRNLISSCMSPEDDSHMLKHVVTQEIKTVYVLGFIYQ
jgi:hypothetical protein